ncbi:MAG: GTPase Era [Treponema sp.]|nr:GTPase Era [Spirochaetia bacterium]MDD7460600.1 GTPase Era [Spirochaetales bacterium]MDY5811165.1 GTPase Era [Treponema sp.]MEE1181693.1 GTPase Era [Treponema sp.]
MNEEILNNEDEYAVEPAGPKTALVSIVGRPSAGKSTFLNTATQETVSIVSSVPQTTRNAIRGIVNTSIGQLVFVDTPGLHLSEKKFNLKLTAIAEENIKDSDEILYILDSTRDHTEEEEMIASLVAPFAKKLVVAINKTEDPNARPENSRAFIHRMLPDFPDSKIIEMSAKEDKGVNDVLAALYDMAEVAPHLYPEEYYTDQEVEFRIAEIIREEAINRLEQELPHAIYVNIKHMEMAKANLLKVRAEICVERDSQKGIVIGKGAQMIKTIRVESIKAARKIFPYRVDIELNVSVDKNWRQKDSVLNKIVK